MILVMLWSAGCGLWDAPPPEPEPTVEAAPAAVTLEGLREDLQAVVDRSLTSGLQVAWIRADEVDTLRLGSLASVEGGIEIGPASRLFTGQLLWEGNLRGHGDLPNTGLLDAVTALVDQTGTSYEELLQHWVLEPLELSGTGIAAPESRVAGHLPDGAVAAPQAWSEQGPVEGLTSSLDDLVVMAQKALETERAPLGWELASGRDKQLRQGGTTPGFFTLLRVDQEAEVAVVMVADTARPELGAVGEWLLRRARGGEGPLELDKVAPEPVVASACVGTYDLSGTPLTVTQNGEGGLLVQMGDGTPALMTEVEPDTYTIVEADARFTCVQEAAGVVALDVVRSGRTARAPRVEE